jgi:hypothetical protein
MKTLKYVRLHKYMEIAAIVALMAIPIALAIASGDPIYPPPDSPF